VLGAGVELRFAANHDAVAIATHAHRHPHVDHYQVDLVDYDVAKMPRVQMAHFSPSCVHHSQANASKVYDRPATLFDHIHGDGPDPEARSGYASSERSRVTMSCVIRYADAHRPDLMIVELSTERWRLPPSGCWSASMWSLWACPQRCAARGSRATERRRSLFGALAGSESSQAPVRT
jgi:DNA (cytosine-5)-methyltransferase 1